MESRYREYGQRQVGKEQAMAVRARQLQEEEMEEATFSPKTNKNSHISQSFEVRL